ISQDERLRARFKGKPEYVMNFMRFIAQELREFMSLLGFRTIDEMVGHSEKLKLNSNYENKVNVSKLLFNSEVVNKDYTFKAYKPNFLENTIDHRVLLPLCKEAIEGKLVKKIDIEISNVNRAFGTILSNEITKVYKEKGLKEDSIVINAKGNAGNSFGAFLTHGVSITVRGDANDYFGKGLCGGKLIVVPPSESTYKAEENIVCGNVALYGATSGECYLEGIAGERFCVRNSGASVVALGCGQHGCEYMTGGTCLILGKIGRNFAAGMSGGIAYIYKQENITNVNKELVSIVPIDDEDEKLIREMMEKHIKYTNSNYVKNILSSYNKEEFYKIIPNDYAKITSYIKEFTSSCHPQPELAAFNKFMEVK
ncbi:MAG: glutamate synthase subunit alpha, partial [Bacilli bacterium]